jgi:hypothetical protein
MSSQQTLIQLQQDIQEVGTVPFFELSAASVAAVALFAKLPRLQ